MKMPGYGAVRVMAGFEPSRCSIGRKALRVSNLSSSEAASKPGLSPFAGVPATSPSTERILTLPRKRPCALKMRKKSTAADMEMVV
jgi:hypothetical protein